MVTKLGPVHGAVGSTGKLVGRLLGLYAPDRGPSGPCDGNASAHVLVELNQQRVAKSYFEQSLLVANQLGFPADIAKPAKELYLINKSMGKHLLALSLLELYIKMKDSLTTSKQLYSKQNKNLVTLLSSKIIADSLKSQKYTNSICTNLIITQEKLVQNKRTIITLITIIALILIFVIFVLFKNKKT